MNVVIGAAMIWAVALWMLRHLRRTRPGDLPMVFRQARRTFLFMLPRVFFGLVGAGFLAALLPPELVARYLGPDSGLAGLLLASGFGVLTPGGPFVAFAIGASALKAGAGAGPLVAYISAWSVVSLMRTLSYELPLMGAGFARRRILVSLPVPLILGGAAQLLTQVF